METEENREEGRVTWHVYGIYLKSAVGIVGPILLIISYTIAEGLLVSSDYWISVW